MKIGIIGAGKVGISLGYVLRSNGIHVVGISDTMPQALDTAREFLGADTLYANDNVEIVNACDVIAIAVQDRLIGEAARSVADRAGDLAGKLFFHTSGADSSSVLLSLERKGAHVGSIHPLQTFPDIESAINVLPDTSIFIEGGDKALDVLRRVGENLGAKVYVIAGEDKVYYHLAAVFVCNLFSALMQAGAGIMRRIDIDFEPFIPIIRATMTNLEAKGPLDALTGPIVRGDDKTISSHLAAMSDMPLHKDIYLAL
ncbi:MAG: 6-phosphogluconate dehydrogenase, NAD-binding protein, partial [Deltaproteobacteria bacterium]|nr:6-phosphogluconate dehydrogenase, NAD-binding protein [Deltaproteobacteria bacterium]